MKPFFVSVLQRLVYTQQPVPTKVVSLTQVVTADELKDDEEYEDIMEDMRTEGGKFGNTFVLNTVFSTFFFSVKLFA